MPRPMHVGINSLYLIPGGVGGSEIYLRNLMRELPHLDNEIEYVFFTNRENTGTFDVGGAPNVREVACPVRAVQRPARLAYEYGVLPLQAWRHGINVLFSPGFTTPARRRYASVAAILDMRHVDLPDTFVSPFYHAIHASLVRHAARSAAHILTLSEYAKRRIVETYHLPPERVTVSHLAADAIFFDRLSDGAIAEVRERYGLSNPYILSVATLHPHKNLNMLLDAVVALRQTTATPIVLALVGLHGDATVTLREKIREAGIEAHVVVTGWVPDADLPALYQGADVFVLPSRYEGFGIPVLEAMASGIPVITTTAASLPEVAGDAALLVDPDDPAALVAALHRVIEEPAVRRDLIARGGERAHQFTWRKTAEATLCALRAANRVRDR